MNKVNKYIENVQEQLNIINADLVDIHKTSAESKTQIEAKVDSIEKDLDDIKSKLDKDFNTIIKYNKALMYIIWFDFEKIHSNKLRKEAKTAQYTNLPDYNKSENKLNSYRPSSIAINTSFSACKSYSIDTHYCIDTRNFDTVRVGENIEIVCSKNKKKEPEVPYESTVACVASRPFDFDVNTIIATAEYLKSILKRDIEYQKYTN